MEFHLERLDASPSDSDELRATEVAAARILASLFLLLDPLAVWVSDGGRK